MKGCIHSIESFSALDGPGIRSVIFLQGCPLRCLYCHNPDTWIKGQGTLVDSSEIFDRISRNLSYISKNGGVTLSGGEPTSQIEFLKELLQGFKAMGLHTAVDTSGYVTIEDVNKIVDYTDLFIVDIKHMDPLICRQLTGRTNSRTFKLLKHLEDLNKDVWIRNVLVPGFTDSEDHIARLCSYVRGLSNVKRFEILPYHDMGKEKYKKLNLQYKLSNMAGYDCRKLQAIKLKYDQYYGQNVIIM